MEIVFATHNDNKLYEVRQILPKKIQIYSLNEINCFDEIAEDADTIEGNALLKAKYVFEHFNKACFADDTGLFVNALNGEPGVYSARYAGEEKSSEANIKKLLNNLKDKQDKSAYFKTVIAYKTHSVEKLFTGICKGKIIDRPRGAKGFGYDPIFIPDQYTKTFAELSPSTKNKISHRGIAMKAFSDFFKI
jgi:XTP/dITP diphosphohydrolase